MPAYQPRTAIRAALLVALASGLVGGCIGPPEPYADPLCFSPDGRMIAYVHKIFSGVCIPVVLAETGPARVKRRVYWRTVSSDGTELGEPHSVDIGCDFFYVGFTSNIGRNYVRGIAFSPDSRHLAVETDEQLLLIDVETERCWRPISGDARVRDAVWLSDGDLGWWEPRRRGWRVCRQKVTDPQAEVELIYEEDQEACDDPIAAWSPGGEYLLIAPKPTGSCRLIDLASGHGQSVTPADGVVTGIAWKPDGSAALMAVLRRAPPEAPNAADATTGLINEFVLLAAESRWREGPYVCSDSDVPRYKLSGRWTPDGRYAVARVGKQAFLIDPASETIFPVADGTTEGWWIGTGGIHPMPLDGWLWTRGALTCLCLDYRSGRVIRMPIGQAWAISPDGSAFVFADCDSTVRVQPLRPILASKLAPKP